MSKPRGHAHAGPSKSRFRATLSASLRASVHRGPSSCLATPSTDAMKVGVLCDESKARSSRPTRSRPWTPRSRRTTHHGTLESHAWTTAPLRDSHPRSDAVRALGASLMVGRDVHKTHSQPTHGQGNALFHADRFKKGEVPAVIHRRDKRGCPSNNCDNHRPHAMAQDHTMSQKTGAHRTVETEIDPRAPGPCQRFSPGRAGRGLGPWFGPWQNGPTPRCDATIPCRCEASKERP